MILLNFRKYIVLFIILHICFFFIFPRILITNPDYKKIVKAIIILSVVILLDVLLSYTKDNFTFELTPEKKCDLGPYMYSSNPERQKLCSQFSEKQLGEYQCAKGFIGRPVHYEYTPESNDKWENPRCSELPDSAPQVL
jgi:hypothetical protein